MYKARPNKHLFNILIFGSVVSSAGIFISFWNVNNESLNFPYFSFVFLLTGVFCAIYLLILINAPPRPDDKNPENAIPLKVQETDNSQVTNNIHTNSPSNIIRGIIPGSGIKTIGEKILSNIADDLEMVQGLFFFLDKESQKYLIISKYAYSGDKDPAPVVSGEGLVGQAIADRNIIELKKVPESYPQVHSGLGKGLPTYLYFIPLINKKDVIGIIEISTFRQIDEDGKSILNFLLKECGSKILSFLPHNGK